MVGEINKTKQAHKKGVNDAGEKKREKSIFNGSGSMSHSCTEMFADIVCIYPQTFISLEYRTIVDFSSVLIPDNVMPLQMDKQRDDGVTSQRTSVSTCVYCWKWH